VGGLRRPLVGPRCVCRRRLPRRPPAPTIRDAARILLGAPERIKSSAVDGSRREGCRWAGGRHDGSTSKHRLRAMAGSRRSLRHAITTERSERMRYQSDCLKRATWALAGHHGRRSGTAPGCGRFDRWRPRPAEGTPRQGLGSGLRGSRIRPGRRAGRSYGTGPRSRLRAPRLEDALLHDRPRVGWFVALKAFG
jgi:hypothetical protein